MWKWTSGILCADCFSGLHYIRCVIPPRCFDHIQVKESGAPLTTTEAIANLETCW